MTCSVLRSVELEKINFFPVSYEYLRSGGNIDLALFCRHQHHNSRESYGSYHIDLAGNLNLFM